MHQIKNVFIDSVFPSQEQAKVFQKNVGAMINEKWQLMLAKWLDEICPSDQHITIDRLDVEAHFEGGSFDLEKWNELVVKLLKERLQDALALKQYDTNEIVSIVSAQSSWLAKKIFFWKTGNLPWNAVGNDFDFPITREDIQKCRDEIIMHSGDLLRLMTIKSFFLRIYTSMNDAAFVAFVSLLRPGMMNLSNNIRVANVTYSLMMPRESLPREIAARMAEFWSWIIDRKSGNRQLSPELTLGFLFKQWRSYSRSNLGSDSGTAIPQQSFNDFLQKLLVLSENKLPGGWNKTIDQIAKQKDPSGQSSIVSQIEHNIFSPKSPERKVVDFKSGEETESVSRKKEKKNQDWLAEDAGVVLLHPFIQMLFVESEIASRDGSLLQLPDLAVQTLHYLVFGSTPFQPHRLATIRCLCGLDDDFVVQGMQMTPELESECDQLLSSVISHWKVLKKTSVEGLRVSFLQRMGLISDEEDHFKLKVEKQSYDLLLDHLPWSYGIVKLPWMGKPMYVQWHNSM